jgi:hypothetical protein
VLAKWEAASTVGLAAQKVTLGSLKGLRRTNVASKHSCRKSCVPHGNVSARKAPWARATSMFEMPTDAGAAFDRQLAVGSAFDCRLDKVGLIVQSRSGPHGKARRSKISDVGCWDKLTTDPVDEQKGVRGSAPESTHNSTEQPAFCYTPKPNTMKAISGYSSLDQPQSVSDVLTPGQISTASKARPKRCS